MAIRKKAKRKQLQQLTKSILGMHFNSIYLMKTCTNGTTKAYLNASRAPKQVWNYDNFFLHVNTALYHGVQSRG